MLSLFGVRRRKRSREPSLCFSSDNESSSPIHSTVPPILHSIVATTGQLPRDLSPTPSKATYWDHASECASNFGDIVHDIASETLTPGLGRF